MEVRLNQIVNGMRMIKDITTNEYSEEVLNYDGMVLVDFWATWCGPCRMVAPILEQLSEEYPEQLKIVKVDADQNSDLVAEYNISSIPTMLVYNKGELVRTLVGAKPKPGILKELADYMAPNTTAI